MRIGRKFFPYILHNTPLGHHLDVIKFIGDNNGICSDYVSQLK